ncbi:MAG: hypothetical protein IH616_09760 [Gemmatimonadales bacterium]|nr:hypothetical protein [Gemmatimonadales bacterium]
MSIADALLSIEVLGPAPAIDATPRSRIVELVLLAVRIGPEEFIRAFGRSNVLLEVLAEYLVFARHR